MWQHKEILERSLPEKLKFAIAKRIENNLFSKVQVKSPHSILKVRDSLFDPASDFLLGWHAIGGDSNTVYS